jgi:guanylate kinase
VYQEEHRKSIDAGSDAFLPKPLEANSLFEHIQQLLGIEWQYQEFTQQANYDMTPISLAAPSAAVLETLLNLTKRGDVEELQKQLHELGQSDERFQPFAEHFQRLAQAFKLNKIKESLQAYLNFTLSS